MMKASAASAEARLGANPPSSPTLVLWPAVVQPPLQGVEDLGAPPHRLGERRRPHRHDHEFLEIDRIVGVDAAIDDVHHRHRQGAGVDAADIAIERQPEIGGGGARGGEAHAENGVGAEPGLVGRAVELDQGAVERRLRLGIEAGQRVENLAIHRRDGAAHALALGSAPCRRPAIRPPRARRSRRPTARRRGRWRRSRARPRPRPSDCRGCRESRARGCR